MSIPIRYARLLTAYLLTAAAVAGVIGLPTAARVHDRVIRGMRIGGQRLEFSHDDHRHVTSEDLQPSVAAAALVAGDDHGQISVGTVSSTTDTPYGSSAILTSALVLQGDAFVRRLAPPGGPHTPRLASFAPIAVRGPPSVS